MGQILNAQPVAGGKTDEGSFHEDKNFEGRMDKSTGRQLHAGAEALLQICKRISG